jgi:transposase
MHCRELRIGASPGDHRRVTRQSPGRHSLPRTNQRSNQDRGFIVAVKILGEVGDVSRLRSKGSFAMLTGTAPIEASSGKTKRHRLNRGGNRQLNYALHMMALARCCGDADTKTYMARLRMEGKSDKEAMRCLKRAIQRRLQAHSRRCAGSYKGSLTT